MQTTDWQKNKWKKGYKHKWQVKRKCQPWFQTFQSENNLLEQSRGYTAVQQPHKNKESS